MPKTRGETLTRNPPSSAPSAKRPVLPLPKRSRKPAPQPYAVAAANSSPRASKAAPELRTAGPGALDAEREEHRQRGPDRKNVRDELRLRRRKEGEDEKGPDPEEGFGGTRPPRPAREARPGFPKPPEKCRPGEETGDENRNEIEGRPRPAVLRCREALEVLVHEVELKEVGVTKRHRDVPRDGQREEQEERPENDRTPGKHDADEPLQEDRRRARSVEGVERAARAPRIPRGIPLREGREGERRGLERKREHRVDERDPRERHEQDRGGEDEAREKTRPHPPPPPREGHREENHGGGGELSGQAHGHLGRAEARGEEVPRGEHLAGNLAVAALIRLEEGNLSGLEDEEEHREEEQAEQSPVDALGPFHRAPTETPPANDQRRSGR